MAVKHWKIVKKKVSELKEHPDNPKMRRIEDHTLRGLGTSIEHFGIVELIVWNKRFDRVVGGHQKLKILKKEKEKETDVIEVDLPEEEERALMLVLNNPHLRGEFVPGAKEAVDLIKEKRPDLYEGLLIGVLGKDIDKIQPKVPEASPPDFIPEMEIQPYEHWDYICIFFKDSRDWMVAVDWFGLKKVKFTTKGGFQKIGLGRNIDGKEFIKLIGGGTKRGRRDNEQKKAKDNRKSKP